MLEIQPDSERGYVLPAFPSALEFLGELVNLFLIEKHPVSLEMLKVLNWLYPFVPEYLLLQLVKIPVF